MPAQTIPPAGAAPPQLLELENVPALKDEVRALAAERDAVILAHNYQLPEVQDVAHFVGDSLGLSRQAAAAWRERPSESPTKWATSWTSGSW